MFGKEKQGGYKTLTLKIPTPRYLCKSFVPSKCSGNAKLTRIAPVSQVFADNISQAVMICFYLVKVRPIFTTRPTCLSSKKDALSILEQTMYIYKFQCPCGTDYISSTIQRLKLRLR